MLQKLAALYALVRNDLALLRYALSHPQRPWWLIPSLGLVALYLVSPIDLVPDALIAVGLIDDLVLIPFAINWIIRQLPPAILDDFAVTERNHPS